MTDRSLRPCDPIPFPLRACGPSTVGRTLPIPGYRQSRMYACGFSSALMVLHGCGRRIEPAELFRRLGTDRSGTRQGAIVREIRRGGLRAAVRYDLDFDRIRREIDAGRPIITYLKDDEHWLVIYGYARHPDRLLVADPRPDHPCEQPWSAWRRRLGGFGIVCSIPPAAAPPPPAHPARRARPEQLALDFGGPPPEDDPPSP